MEAETAEERKTRKKNNERKKGEPNIQESTPTDVKEKSEQPTSEYGVRNSSRSSLTGEKEEDTESKSTRVKPTPGELLVKKRNS